MSFEIARNQMLAQQVRAWNVLDGRVLDVLRATPRESFVAETDRDLAFADTELPIGHGQKMMSPMIEGRVLQALALDPLDEVLEIGTGSGYLTACLAQLAASVHSIEIFADLSTAAAARVGAAGVRNVTYEAADAFTVGGKAGYDAIAVTGSVPVAGLLNGFIAMLKPRGRLFCVVGRSPVMEALVITARGDGSTSATSVFETEIDPLINATDTEPFVL